MDTDVLTDMIIQQTEEAFIEELDKKTTASYDTRKTKIRRAAGQMATYEGRRKNDPIYKKMIMYRDLYYKYRDLLKKKYRAEKVNKARR